MIIIFVHYGFDCTCQNHITKYCGFQNMIKTFTQCMSKLDYEVLLQSIDSTGFCSTALHYLSTCLSFESCSIFPVELDTP